MILKFLATTFLAGQFITVATAQDPLTNDPIINGYSSYINTEVSNVNSQLEKLSSLHLEAQRLIQNDLNLADFLGKMDIVIQGLTETKIIAIAANSDAVGDHERYMLSFELQAKRDYALDLLSSILDNWDRNLSSVYPLFNPMETRDQATALRHKNCLTTSQAAAYQANLAPFLDSLLDNLTEIKIGKDSNLQALKLNSIDVDRTKMIANSSIGSVKSLLDLVKKRIDGN